MLNYIHEHTGHFKLFFFYFKLFKTVILSLYLYNNYL